ncbi:MAG TPA: deoxyribodipyrimidine photo-lyase [Fimbriimonadaceae bacterium]|nr:deoxyribodipyrimidine photo-lyase [Fimbriimonadaceae bacterium]
MATRALCWIRRDLRLDDHAALAFATEHYDRVAVAFVFDTSILGELKDEDDARVTFILDSLTEVREQLRTFGSDLLICHGDPLKEVVSMAKTFEVDAVVAARDYEPYAKKRDREVENALKSVGVGFQTVHDHVIFEGHEVMNGEGLPFRVFTPYKKAWLARFEPSRAEHRKPDYRRLMPMPAREDVDVESIGFRRSQPWLVPGESAAQERLADFSATAMSQYGETRDFPAVGGVSCLSAYLRFGNISTRACVRAALASPSAGADKWLSELIWREFYQMILDQFPEVTETTFNPAYRGLNWPGTDERYQAWERGETGYPIVDAAMRCLNETGWMHNRLRMVVASFLTKDLLVDYRRGEAHFARKLLDFDLAQNNGGWQWAASTGVDAQPYFRIFNPILQSRKFDAEGKFIRTWLPEVAGFDNEQIHCPWLASAFDQAAAGCVIGDHYPAPIVDHAVQKDLAVRLLSRTTQGS